MSEDRCKAGIYGDYRLRRCNNKAGYGPDKAYCKIHAREKGEVFGSVVTLYQVKEAAWKAPRRLVQIQAEETAKTYRTIKGPGNSYRETIRKDELGYKRFFLTPQEALDSYLEDKHQAVEAAQRRLEEAQKEFYEAQAFVSGEEISNEEK